MGTPTTAPIAVRSRSKPKNSSRPAAPMKPAALPHCPRYRWPSPGTIARAAASAGLLRGRARFVAIAVLLTKPCYFPNHGLELHGRRGGVPRRGQDLAGRQPSGRVAAPRLGRLPRGRGRGDPARAGGGAL